MTNLNIWEEVSRKVKQVVDEKGMTWLVAALVEGSLGYYTPAVAKVMVETLLKGKPYCSERTALFGDPLYEVEHAVEWFEYIEKTRPDKAQRIIEFVKEMEKRDDIDQLTMGLMYPSMLL